MTEHRLSYSIPAVYPQCWERSCVRLPIDPEDGENANLRWLHNSSTSPELGKSLDAGEVRRRRCPGRASRWNGNMQRPIALQVGSSSPSVLTVLLANMPDKRIQMAADDMGEHSGQRPSSDSGLLHRAALIGKRLTTGSINKEASSLLWRPECDSLSQVLGLTERSR